MRPDNEKNIGPYQDSWSPRDGPEDFEFETHAIFASGKIRGLKARNGTFAVTRQHAHSWHRDG
jgi:hypothetical protein